MSNIAKRWPLFFFLLVSLVGFIAGCEHVVTQPEINNVSSSNDVDFVAPLEYLKHLGAEVQNKRGLFVLNWGLFAFPDSASSGLVTTVTAAYFESINRQGLDYPRGIDIGEVKIKARNDEIELRKYKTPHYGIFYRFGASGNGYRHDSIPFEASATYQYIVSGSKYVGAFNVVLSSPPALIKITNPSQNEKIDIRHDLRISWQGGILHEKIMITVSPSVIFKGDECPTVDQLKSIPAPITDFLETNHGEFIVSSERLQDLIRDLEKVMDFAYETRLSCIVSQFSAYDVEVDNSPLLFFTENSDWVELQYR